MSKRLYADIQQFVPEDKVRYCYNGIKHQGIETVEDGKNNKTIEILFLSNLIESKGVNVLLDAGRRLVDKGINFHCTFVGGIGDITEADFHRYVEERELSSNVSYPGRMLGNQKDEILAHSDIFAFPTYYTKECFPLVLLEAMSFSLPVVSTFEGGIPDVVEHGVTGFLCPQKDAEALAEKLSLLISDKKLRIKMGKAGRERYEENFTLEIFEQRFASIIESIVGSE